MRTNYKYSFLLQSEGVDGSVTTRAVHPAYDKLSLKYAKEDGEVYYRRSLDNEFTFMGDDCEFIISKDLRTKFTLMIYSNGQQMLTTKFKIGDGEVDVNHMSFKVTTTLDDEWKKLSDKKDDEYNLVDILKGQEKSAHVKLLPSYQIIEYNGSGETQTKTHNYISGAWTDFDAAESFSYERELFSKNIAGDNTLLDVFRGMHITPSFFYIKITGAIGKTGREDMRHVNSFIGEYSNIVDCGKWIYPIKNEVCPFDEHSIYGQLTRVDYYTRFKLYLYKDHNPSSLRRIVVNMYLPLKRMKTPAVNPYSSLIDKDAVYSFYLEHRISSQASTWYKAAFTAYDRFGYMDSWVERAEEFCSGSQIHTSTDLASVLAGRSASEYTQRIDMGYPMMSALNGMPGHFKLMGSFAMRSVLVRGLGTITDIEYQRWVTRTTIGENRFYNLYRVDHELDLLAGSNYRWAYAYTGDYNIASISTRTISSTTRWGLQDENGNYFLPPTDGKDLQWQPICIDIWHNGYSIWINGDDVAGLNHKDESTVLPISDYHMAYKFNELKNFYTIGDAIKGLLGKIDNTIVFKDDEEHSQFLFSSINPVTNNQQGEYWLTQKSNLLQYAYDYAAWKAPCTLDQIFTMLKYVFNCYYDLYQDKGGTWHLRIEHIMFYMNGLSYNAVDRKRVRLDRYYDSRNKKPLSFRTNNWKYGNGSQPSRIEFEWMDTQSEPFAGYPIVIPEEYMIYSEEKTQKNRVDMFSTDVNFMLAVPSECSSDGFLLAEVVDEDGVRQIYEGNAMMQGQAYAAQNIRLAYCMLHPSFFLYNIYSDVVNINGGDVSIIKKTAKLRENSVEFNLPDNVSIDPHYLFTTEAGDGEVSDIEIDLSCNKVTATLTYELKSAPLHVFVPSSTWDESGNMMICEDSEPIMTEYFENILIEQ